MPRHLAFRTLLASSLFISAFAVTSIAYAQKLPAKQEGSVKAPAGIAIDGQLNEWGGELKAYNKGTRFFYTVSNDSKFAYFSIRVTDPLTVQKVLLNNVTITVGPLSDTKKKEVSAVTFPAMNARNKRSVFSNSKFLAMKTTDQSLAPDDSVLLVTNRKLAAAGKGKLTGGLAGNSAYQLAASIDTANALTLEVAIPLEVARGNGADAAFRYVITLNGDQDPNAHLTADGSPYAETASGGNSSSIPAATFLVIITKSIEGEYSPLPN